MEGFSEFRNKRVVVVGAGASGLDLLINTMKVRYDSLVRDTERTWC